MDRREFGGTLLGAAMTAGFGQVQIPDKVDNAHVRYLRATVERLYRQDQQIGGARLAHGALRQYHRARRMLDESDYTGQVGTNLMGAAGDLAVCVGWLAYDAGDQQLSHRLYGEALLLAAEAGDDSLSIRVMEKMALQSVFLAQQEEANTGRRAVRLAVRAADLSRREPSARLHALLAAREAIGHATMGDAREFNRSMAQAWREIDRGTDPNDPTWLQFVNPGEIRVHEAKGKNYLGDHAEAARLFGVALEQPGLSPRNTVNYRAQLAASLAAEGEAEIAIAEGTAVLDAVEKGKVASPRTLRELHTVREAGERTDAEEFCVRYDAMRSAAEVVK